MAESFNLRYPHIARDLITFTAEDDVWLASLSEVADGRGTRAWRLTADRVPVLHPRLNPSATHVAWTSTRDGTLSLNWNAPREVGRRPRSPARHRRSAGVAGARAAHARRSAHHLTRRFRITACR